MLLGLGYVDTNMDRIAADANVTNQALRFMRPPAPQSMGRVYFGLSRPSDTSVGTRRAADLLRRLKDVGASINPPP